MPLTCLSGSRPKVKIFSGRHCGYVVSPVTNPGMIVKLGKLGSYQRFRGKSQMPPLEESRRDTKEQEQIKSPDQNAATDSLRKEAFQRVDQTTARPDQGTERRSVNSVLSQNFDNPVNHLDNARTALKSGDFQGAEREYFASI